jgi:guanylate kinase
VNDDRRMAAYKRPMAQTPHRLPTDTDNGLLLIMSGPSGAGKTTITRGV